MQLKAVLFVFVGALAALAEGNNNAQTYPPPAQNFFNADSAKQTPSQTPPPGQQPPPPPSSPLVQPQQQLPQQTPQQPQQPPQQPPPQNQLPPPPPPPPQHQLPPSPSQHQIPPPPPPPPPHLPTHQQPTHVPSQHQPPTHVPSQHQPPTHVPSQHQPPTHVPSQHQPPTHVPSQHQPPTRLPSQPQHTPTESQTPKPLYQFIHDNPKRPLLKQPLKKPPPYRPNGFHYLPATPVPFRPLKVAVSPYVPETFKEYEPKFKPDSRPNNSIYSQKFANAAMLDFYRNYIRKMKRAESEIVANNDALYLRFIAWERNLNTKHDIEINEAVRDGRDKYEIEDCLFKKKEFLRVKLHSKWKRIDSCRTEATKIHRKILSDLGKAYAETLMASSNRERNWGKEIYLCHEDERCVKKANDSLTEDFKMTMQEGERVLKQVREAPQKHRILLDYCVQNFFEELDDYEKSFLTLLLKCVDQSKSYFDEYKRRKRSIKVDSVVEKESNA